MDRLTRSPTILLLVLEHVELPTLLSLRLTNRATKTLIDDYERSICTTIALRCYSRDPSRRQSMMLASSIQSLHRMRRKDICRKFAIVVTSAAWRSHGFEAPFEDEDVDSLRTRVERGCHLFWRLSDISRSVEATRARDAVKKPFFGSQRLGTRRGARAVEAAVLERRLKIVETMSESDMADFDTVSYFITGVFKHAQMGGLEPALRIKWALGREASWINWYILHEGPPLLTNLFKCWTRDGLSENVPAQINALWLGKSKSERKIQSEAGAKVFERLRRKSPAREEPYAVSFHDEYSL